MTPDQQARERLAREATPGPWTTDTDANEQQMVLAVDADFWVALCPHQCLRSIEVQAEKNAKHIAANSPAVILADLARLRALEEQLQNIRAIAARGRSFGHQATSQTPERMVARKDEALSSILDRLSLVGYGPSCLRVRELLLHLADAQANLNDVASKLVVEDARTTLQAKTIRALEDEQRALTERVQHLLTTIAVERTGRKEAEEEVARLRGALAALPGMARHTVIFGGPYGGNRTVPALLVSTLREAIDAALHAQDTEVGR